MTEDNNNILAVNVGSSSIKLAIYSAGDEQLIAELKVTDIGTAESEFIMTDASGKELSKSQDNFKDHAAAMRKALEALKQADISPPAAAGHRLVHGGQKNSGPLLINNQIMEYLQKSVPLAPLHLPNQIRAIEIVAERHPDMPQVVCFDTSFHNNIYDTARTFPIPYELTEEGLIRYGFHGLSYEYIISVLKPADNDRTVIAHLGNGASLAAVKGARSIDTTMGFTPAGGIMMGTRPGDLDPGVLIYLLRQKNYNAEKLDDMINNKSGLLGVAGISSDMKVLLENYNDNPRAKLAVDIFCCQIKKQVAAFAAALAGLDNLIFTGGIGEKASAVREQICDGLGFIGIELDPAANKAGREIISKSNSPCRVRIIPANEELMLARHTSRLMQDAKS